MVYGSDSKSQHLWVESIPVQSNFIIAYLNHCDINIRITITIYRDFILIVNYKSYIKQLVTELCWWKIMYTSFTLSVRIMPRSSLKTLLNPYPRNLLKLTYQAMMKKGVE